MRNGIVWSALVATLFCSSVYADISVCPKVSDIKASAFKSPDANIPEPYNEGFQYSAPSPGKPWHGEALATEDTFLESKYALKAESVDETDKQTVCSYGGTTVTGTDGSVSKPYLKLILDK